MNSTNSSDDEFLVLESPVAASSKETPTIHSAEASSHSPPSLFYDEGNSVVISVSQDRSNQFLDVVAVSMKTGWRRCLRFARPELMKAIKFSPDLAVVSALWEKSATFEFVNLPGEHGKHETSPEKLMPYSYTCVPQSSSRHLRSRGESFEVYGCEWLTSDRLVVVTSSDVELLACTASKRQVKLVKSHFVPGGIIWYKWAALPPSSISSTWAILAVFTKANHSSAQPLLIRSANVLPLSRFEIDTGSSSNIETRPAPRQQDVAMLKVYNSVYLVVLLLQPRAFDDRSYAELLMYQFLPNQSCFIKTRIIRLFPFDSLAIAFSVVDELLIAHHQTTQTCLVFDLNIPSEYDQFVSYYSSLLPPQPATWLSTSDIGGSTSVRVPVLPDLLLRVDGLEAWRLKLKTESLLKRIISNATPSVDEAGLCLLAALGRSDQSAKWLVVDAAKRALLDLDCRYDKEDETWFSQSYFLRMQKSRFDFFTKILPALATGGGSLQDADFALIANINPTFTFRQSAIPNQSQLANGAFEPALRSGRPKVAIRVAFGVLMEYIQAIVTIDRPVDFSLAELLVHHFSSAGLFQLYQLLQYRVVSDSVPLACSLLALSRSWPAGFQLSLDMLRRLPNGRGISHAAEVLLNSGAPPVEAVRLLINAGALPSGLNSSPSSGFLATTPSHMLAANNSRSPSRSPSSPSNLGATPTLLSSTSPQPPVISATAMDPRKPLDFAVSSENPAQLMAILTHHHQSAQSSQGNQAWLIPYWKKLQSINK